MDIQRQLDDFVATNNGYPLEVEDPSNRDQCMDLAFGWCEVIGIPHSATRHLYAYEVFTKPTDITYEYFDVVAYQPGMVAPTGSLVVWKPRGRFTGIAGHIDLALSGSSSTQFRAFDQNWASHDYCEILVHPYDDVLGWLIPKGINQGIQDMPSTVDQATAQKLAYVMAGRDPSEPANLIDLKENHVGREVIEDINNWWDSDEHRQYAARVQENAATAVEVVGLRRKVADLTSQYQTLVNAQSQPVVQSPVPATPPTPVQTPTQSSPPQGDLNNSSVSPVNSSNDTENTTTVQPLPTVEPVPLTPGLQTSEGIFTGVYTIATVLLQFADIPLPTGSPSWLEGAVKGAAIVGNALLLVSYNLTRAQVKTEAIKGVAKVNENK